MTKDNDDAPRKMLYNTNINAISSKKDDFGDRTCCRYFFDGKLTCTNSTAGEH